MSDAGLAQAFAEARRRRQRTALATLSGAAVLLAVPVVLLGGSTPTGEQRIVPSTESPTATAFPSISQPGSATATPTETAAPRRTPNSSATASPTAASSPTPAPGSEPRGDQEPEYTSDGSLTVCGANINAPNPQWCLSVVASPESPREGEGAELSLTACRSTQNSDGTLRFHSRKEADWSIERNGKEVWRWSSGRAFGSEGRQYDADTGKCWTWSASWEGRDAAGRVLPAGDYELVGTLYADEVDSPDRASLTIGR